MGDINYLFEPEGSELHWTGLQEKQKPAMQQASLSGPSPSYSHPMERQGLGGTVPTASSYKPQPAAQETHKMSPDELYKYAQDMLNQQEVQNSHALAMGPATGSRDDAGSKTPAWLSDYMDKQDKDL